MIAVRFGLRAAEPIGKGGGQTPAGADSGGGGDDGSKKRSRNLSIFEKYSILFFSMFFQFIYLHSITCGDICEYQITSSDFESLNTGRQEHRSDCQG